MTQSDGGIRKEKAGYWGGRQGKFRYDIADCSEIVNHFCCSEGKEVDDAWDERTYFVYSKESFQFQLSLSVVGCFEVADFICVIASFGSFDFLYDCF